MNQSKKRKGSVNGAHTSSRSKWQSAKLDCSIFGEDAVAESDVIKFANVPWTGPASGPSSAGAAMKEFDFFLVLVKHPESNAVKEVLGVAKEKASNRSEGKKQSTVARLNGFLLKRGHKCFFEDADMISGSLQEAACTFFNSTGEHCRINHDTLAPRSLGKGGFLFVDQVESAIPGIDLGIHLLHETFVFLQKDFSLAVMEVSTLTESACQYEVNKQRERDLALFEKRADTTPQKAYELKLKSLQKVQRQYARLGFTQTPGHPLLWFLSKKRYFSIDAKGSTVPANWMSKDMAANIPVEAIESPPRAELDEELHHAIQKAVVLSSPDGFMSPSRFGGPIIGSPGGRDGLSDAELTEICCLVNRGASIDGAQGLHLAAGMWKTPSLFQLLKALGGDVNCPDGKGIRPLQVAATASNLEGVRALLNLGADKSLKDREGKLPKDAIADIRQNSNDFAMTFGLRFANSEDNTLNQILELLQ